MLIVASPSKLPSGSGGSLATSEDVIVMVVTIVIVVVTVAVVVAQSVVTSGNFTPEDGSMTCALLPVKGLMKVIVVVVAVAVVHDVVVEVVLGAVVPLEG